METNQKIDNTLSLSISVTEEEREQSAQLRTGYDSKTKYWQVIVKFTENLENIEKWLPGSEVTRLYNNYGIVQLPETELERLAMLPQIQFVEKPKQLFFSLEAGRSVSCINSLQREEDAQGLFGKGVLVGVADTGLDLFHPAFRKEDGSSRVRFFWDQSGEAVEEEGLQAPEPYGYGVEWNQEQINRELMGMQRQLSRLPKDTGSGHGTAVTGIAAGNGRGSQGLRYRGVATQSDILFVKLASQKEEFPKTAEVMEALNYLVQKAISLNMPMAVNLSFGNNYGAHNGQSLFENYIAELADVWKTVFVIASGNEGDARHHAKVVLKDDYQEIEFAVGEYEKNISLQIWKDYSDSFAIFLENPAGKRKQIEVEPGQSQQFLLGNNQILLYYGEPKPFGATQEIYLEWIPVEGASQLESGIWKILLIPQKIKNGVVDLWLPTIEAVGLSTGFLKPVPENTLTIPSAARRIISVGAYNQNTMAYASFSGRGETTDRRYAPIISAPGVDIVTTSPGGGYTGKTGTSMAAPFVAGAAALLMEWGIVIGNDPYLYGEKVKAYLISGARELPGIHAYPDNRVGWGTLCAADSIPK